MAKLHLDGRLNDLGNVLLLRNNDCCAHETAQQALVMMLRVGRDVAAMMKTRLALVAVD